MEATELVEAEAVVEEQAETGVEDDQYFDNIEDAAKALADDDEPEEQPAPEEDDDLAVEESAADDNVEVTLDDGEKVSLKELKAGYFRQKDYTHKSTENAQERKAVEAIKAEVSERATVMETALQNLATYLQNAIPPEPPRELAFTDPGRHYALTAQRQDTIAELSRILSVKGEVEGHKQALTEAEMREIKAQEGVALVKAMPELADPVKKAAFDGRVKAAAKQFGFTDAEIDATIDHRVLRMVELARIGQKAIENRKNAEKRVETPKIGKARTGQPPVHVENRKAMHRLAQTGSIKDALKVDFD